jgi:hypothetical protein
MHAALLSKPLTALGRTALVCLALGLGACASTRVVDSEVRSFSGSVGPATPATYRFDRLPSQIGDAQSQAVQETLETQASAAMAEVGLTQSDDQPQYLAQISAALEQVARTPVRAPFAPAGLAGSWGLRYPPVGFGMNWAVEPPWSRYTVQIVLRDARSKAVVFESAAQHIGPWADSANIMPAVLGAALRDYPKPTPQGTTVRIEVSTQGLTDRP